jgi:hypothetical protein
MLLFNQIAMNLVIEMNLTYKFCKFDHRCDHLKLAFFTIVRFRLNKMQDILSFIKLKNQQPLQYRILCRTIRL